MISRLVAMVVNNSTTCGFCNCQIPLDRTQCPHCAQPQLFPNVRLAERPEEQQKLLTRYQEAQVVSQSRGCENAFSEFDRACESSLAVFSCSIVKLFRSIASGTDLYETYHDLERLRIHYERPSDHNWQKLRPQAEIELLGSHQHLDKLHYAALSLDGVGLDSYGECTVILREQMISHRASCFEGNSGLIYDRHHDFSGCLRSSWANRAKLCVAKAADQLNVSSSSGDFPGMLLSPGATQDDDEFVEVHVFGTMTARTFQSIAVDSSRLAGMHKTMLKAIREKLAQNAVTLLER